MDFDPGPGVANLTSNGESSADPGWGGDIVVAKYNQAGQYQWAFNVGSTQTADYGLCITADPAGNVYVGGRFDGQVDFDPGSASTLLNSATGGPIFLAKYNTTGAFQWAFNVGLVNNDNAVFGLRADNAGNVYATGFFQGTNIDFDPGSGVAGLSSAGGYEAFLAKYNTNGQYQWAFRIGGGGLDTGRDLTLDNSGNVYLTGDFNGSNIDFDPSPATAPLSSNGGSDVFLAKYNSSGQYQWAFNFGGTSGDIGWWVTTDNNHLFITGGFTGTADLNPSNAVDNLVSAGGYDIFLGKYTLNGEYVCSFKVGGSGDDFGYSIVSGSNNIFSLSGSFQGSNVDFDPTPSITNLSSAGSDDIFLAKYTWPDNITPASGTLAGGTICMGEQAQLTFTATAGTGPFTIVYNNGTTNITRANVQSGVPFTVTPAPAATTTYTLVSVRDAQLCSEPNAPPGVTAVVTVNDCGLFTPDCSGLQLALGTGSAYDRAIDVAAAADGNFYVVAESESFTATRDILFTKLTPSGTVLWSRTYGANGIETVRKITPTADGGLLVIGQTRSFNIAGEIFAMKLGNNGLLAWSRRFGLGSANGDLGMDIIETSDGGYAISGIINVAGGVADAIVIKLNSTVNIQWTKRFNSGVGEDGVGIVEKDNALVVAMDHEGAGSNYDIIVTKLNIVDGSVAVAKRITPSVRGVFNPYLFKNPSGPGYYISGHTIDQSSYSNMNQVVITLDEDFNIVKSRLVALNTSTKDGFTGFVPLADGSFIGTTTSQPGNADATLYRVNADNSVRYAKTFDAAANRRLYRVAVAGQTVMAVGGLTRDGQEDMFVTVFNLDGTTDVSCDVQNAAVTIQQPSYTVSSYSWPTITSPSFAQTAATMVSSLAGLGRMEICSCSLPPAPVPVPCNNWLGTPSTPSYASAGDLDISGNQITIEAIINRTQPYSPGTGDNNEGDIVSKHIDPATTNYLLRPNHGYIRTTNGFFATPDICEIELNKTYHVALVYDGSTLKFYRNGYLMSSVAATGNLVQNDFPLRMGLYSGTVLENFLGYTNEVRIWSVARTQDDLRTYMNASLPTPVMQVGLRGYYTFDNLLNKQGNPAFNITALTGSAVINQTNPQCTFVADSCVYKTVDCNQWMYTPALGAKMTAGDVDVTGTQLTVEATFNRTQPLNNGLYYGHLVSKHTGQTNVNYALLPNGCEITTSNGYKSTFQTCPVELNKTYHVAMVYDGATLKYYQNGFLMSQVPCTGTLVTNDLVTTIGQVAGGSNPVNNQFLGYINEVRVWNVARTQAQIRTFMNAALPAPASQAGLRAYYTFDNMTNDQGNAAYNGLLTGGAVINQTNPQCTFVADSCRVPATPVTVTADFTIPATVCVNDPVPINNTSQNATSYYWSFCAADPTINPVGTNLGNPGSSLVSPVYSDLVKVNGNYYLFVVNHWPGGLVRLDFGNSYLNTPTAVSLGNVGGIIPNSAEGIQVIYNNGHWLALVMAGSPPNAIASRIIKIDFGSDITNTSPVGTNWGNIGGLNLPHELHAFQENGNWYGLVVNAEDNTVTRISFTNDLVNNAPTGVNLGTFSGLNYPTGINAVNDNGNWHVFITSDNPNPSLVRLDFGNSLLNPPVAVNLGNPGGMLNKTRDIYILKDCGQINAYAINGFGVNQLLKLNFGSSITSVPVITNLGNTGSMNFPHSISRIFRVGNDLYMFVSNVTNNSITRIRIPGCTSSSFPNAAVQNPAPVTYNTPGTYNITLTIDDGLPTQTTVCRQVTVTDCTPLVINQYTEVLAFDACNNKLTVSDASAFNVGDTVLMIQMKGAAIDSTNTASFGTITDYKSAGNYEFNYIKGKNGNTIELLNVVKRQYDIPVGKVQLVRVPYFQDYEVTRPLTAAAWDGSKGGVLAFNVQNSLTLNADIDVSGKGFRGGSPLNSSVVTCSQVGYYYAPATNNGAQKGEGIHLPLSLAKSYGRGAPSNGGGGGNAHNSGGGGGSNAGSGGQGGNQWDDCGSVPENIGGKGGTTLNTNVTLNRLYLGGGGGMGHGNNVMEYPAGNGGGIIIITAGSLTNNGKAIKANGTDAAPCSGAATCGDGMSGGGAGGSILLDISSVNTATVLETRGGRGADQQGASGVRHGPGGGGGGGFIAFRQPVASILYSITTTGGLNGVNTNIGNDPHGATSGGNGTNYTGFEIIRATQLFKPNIDSVRIRKMATSCSHFDFEGLGYTNTAPVAAWQWYIDGAPAAATQNTSYTFTTAGNHDVKLVITDANGCKDSMLTTVQVVTPDFDFTYSRDVCDPLTVQFTGIGSSTANPYWAFGDGNTTTGALNTSHTYAAAGNYTVRYSTGNGVCTDTLNKTISVDVTRDNIVLTRDTTICYGTTKQLLSGPSLDFCWSPVTYLDNPASPNPVTSAPEDITYYLTAQVTGSNLIVNGDFTQGNTGFTSGYTHSMPNTNEGQYFIGTNPRAWNGGMSACGDHTSGTGNMMMVNGSPVTDVNVWRQTVTVTPNTNYAFSTWIQSVFPSNPAQLQFSINGNNIGNLITATVPVCNWAQFYTTWNSGNSTSAVISIVNKNTVLTGNDFALDDISFAPVFIRRDSVKIAVEKPLVTTNNDTTVCGKSPVQLIAAGAQDYTWSPATALTDPSVFNPVASPEDTTRYIVTGTTINGCVAKDTVYVNVFAKPDITTSEDATICKNTSVPLSATGGVFYSWFPAATLTNPGTPNPVATPAGDMTYYVSVTDVNDCAYLDSVKIAIRADAVFTVNGAGSVCKNDSLQLSASGGDIYSWYPATGLSNTAIANPKASPAATMDYTVSITESECGQSKDLPVKVTILPLPNVQATRSNDIDCSYGESQLLATGAGSYRWTPSAGLSNSLVASPVATPDLTTSYIVAGTNAAGCKNYDTVLVKVEASNKGDYLMPNAFTPNNDGLNDCYGIKIWGVVEELEFSIYNRWGELIFFTKNAGQCWDGTYKGVKQNSGVFVYMIRARTNCESKVFRKGTFVLIR
ncbi:MAG: LamG-like jellyroll fold domain-containing protein [Chitinophagaceae bacterium]